MAGKLVPRPVLFLLIAAGAVLLISGFVTLGLGELLWAMGDPFGRPLKYVALGCGALCVVDLICLVLAQAVNSLAETDEPPDQK